MEAVDPARLCVFQSRTLRQGQHRGRPSHFPPVESDVADVCVSAATLLELPETLRRRQEAFDRTGGLHAAGLFDLTGALLIAREDVGRDNAADKVLGRALLDGLLPCDKHILLVSGRASFEIVQKALAGRVPIICGGFSAIEPCSAPNSRAAAAKPSWGLWGTADECLCRRRTCAMGNRMRPGPNERLLLVAQTSESAVSPVSKPARRTTSNAQPIWKSATPQVWKPARRHSRCLRCYVFGLKSRLASSRVSFDPMSNQIPGTRQV